MKPEARTADIDRVVWQRVNNIGVSYLRLSVAASDLNEYPFSYHDVEEADKDSLLLAI
jgi:glucosylceramidase